MAHLNLVSISLVFIVVPLFWFLLVYFPFHRGTAGNPVRYNAGRLDFFLKKPTDSRSGERWRDKPRITGLRLDSYSKLVRESAAWQVLP
jgi:hypothetical protein